MTCQACKVAHCAVEFDKHPSNTSAWNLTWARKMLAVKKFRCEDHGGQEVPPGT